MGRFPENCVHIKGIGDGISGYSVLDYLADNIGLGIAQQKYACSFFANGAVPLFALEHDTIKTEEQRAETRQGWDAIHRGPTNAHKLALMPLGAHLNKLSVDPINSQLIESRKLSLIDFANALGIPHSFLGAATNTSYSSLEHEDRAFLRGIDFWLVQWEAEVSAKLLTEAQQEYRTHYAEFKRETLVRVDIATEQSLLIGRYHGGLQGWEETRELMNLPTKPDGHFLRPSTLVPETFGEEPPPPPPIEPPTEEPTEEVKQSKDDRLEHLTASTLGRLFKRLEKASSGKGPEWVLEDMETHRAVFCESLEPVAPKEKIEKLWADLQQELHAISSQDWPIVFQHKDIIRIAEGLCS